MYRWLAHARTTRDVASLPFPGSNLNVEVPGRVEDKRLQIELNGLGQSIFADDGRRTVEVYPEGGDRVEWCEWYSGRRLPHEVHETVKVLTRCWKVRDKTCTTLAKRVHDAIIPLMYDRVYGI